MIISPITGRWAQWSYDEVTNHGPGSSGNAPLVHMGIQLGNMVAHMSTPVVLTRMSNPNLMSFAYKGLDPLRFGTAAAVASRREFQMASSRAFRMGENIGGTIFKGTRYASRGARLGGRFAFKAIPGIGWGMLAYDAYDLIANKRLFGVKL